MFSHLKLGTKLAIAFSVLAVVTLFLGAIGYVSVNRSNAAIADLADEELPAVDGLLNIQIGAGNFKALLRTLMVPGLDPAVRARQYEDVKTFRAAYEEKWKQYEDLPRTPQEDEIWQRFTPAWQAWRTANNEFFRLCKEADELKVPDPVRLRMELDGFIAAHLQLELDVMDLIYEGATFDGGDSAADCPFQKWATTFKADSAELAESLRLAVSEDAKLHAAIGEIRKAYTAGDKEAASSLEETAFMPANGALGEHFAKMKALATKSIALFDAAQHECIAVSQPAQDAALAILRELVDLRLQSGKKDAQAAYARSAGLKRLTLGAMIAGAAGSLVLGLLITRSITRPIHRIVEELGLGAARVAEASEQVNQSSEQLAAASTEQATSLEETTAALENMSSMSVQNASSAKEANALVTQARTEADHSDKEMTRLNGAMAAINESSQQISRIIKVIEEIAFQTNLLALNAAVEAARAGEHGKGFAVVADEVRNLAQRAAQAARETTTLIEASVTRAKEGTDVSNAFGNTLAGIVDNVTRASSLVGQIDAASQAQSEGVEQIRIAVTQMDQVTQSIAASSEESAAAVQELSAQATAVADTADRLGSMVGVQARRG